MKILFILFWVQLVSPPTIQFSNEGLDIDSNSGYLQLEWESSTDINTYILQQSTTPDFNQTKNIYQGPDQASFISGLDNGTYYFRIGNEHDQWSKTLTLNVQHQSLSLAYVLFALGFLVFALTVFIVIKGVRNSAAIHE